jgi:hypothetical protein
MTAQAIGKYFINTNWEIFYKRGIQRVKGRKKQRR